MNQFSLSNVIEMFVTSIIELYVLLDFGNTQKTKMNLLMNYAEDIGYFV